MVREPVEPRLRPEGPQLRIAENEHKNPGQKKTHRPGIANIRPAHTKARLRKNENSRQYHKKSSQVMIEFAFAFIGSQFFRSMHPRVWGRRTHVHPGHVAGHPLVGPLTSLGIVALLRGMILRAKPRLEGAKYQGKQQPYT